MEKNKTIEECMKIILNNEWAYGNKRKKVWEWIKAGTLTSAPAFKGKKYDDATTKIMYVGHALNGWELDVSSCFSCEDILNSILCQNDGLETIVKEGGDYKHSQSKFWRLIKQVMEFLEESETPTDEKWYNDSMQWNEKFIWYNLYNVAPKGGGNPGARLIRPCIEQYVNMFKAFVESYEPDVVIVCPLKGWFKPWKNESSFSSLVNYTDNQEKRSVILGEGQLGKSKVIVCSRPDQRGIGYNQVKDMAKCISEYIKDVKNKKG